MPRKTDGLRYIMRLPEPMSRNICHSVPLAPKINYELSGCSHGRRCLICTEKSHLSFTAAESFYIASSRHEREKKRQREREPDREREKEYARRHQSQREKTQDELGVAPDLTDATLILFRHSLEIPTQIKSGLASNLSESLDSQPVLDMLDASKPNEHLCSPVFKKDHELQQCRDFYSIAIFHILSFIFLIVAFLATIVQKISNYNLHREIDRIIVDEILLLLG